MPDFYGVFVRGLETRAASRSSRGGGGGASRTKLQAILGLHEFRLAIAYGAALTKLNFTFLLMFFHVSIVRTCVHEGAFASPVLAIAVAKGVVILLCMCAGYVEHAPEIWPASAALAAEVGWAEASRAAWVSLIHPLALTKPVIGAIPSNLCGHHATTQVRGRGQRCAHEP